MKGLIFSFLFLAMPGALDAASCYCKVLCFSNGEDSSDFYKLVDVSCTDTIELQKKMAKQILMNHIKEKHPVFTEDDVKSKTEIMCFRSTAEKNKNQNIDSK